MTLSVCKGFDIAQFAGGPDDDADRVKISAMGPQPLPTGISPLHSCIIHRRIICGVAAIDGHLMTVV
jgi:hypothetical protein